MATPAEKVAKGVAYLDERVPDWREHVDLDPDRFNIQRSDRCIVGQLARAGAIPGVDGGLGTNFWAGWNSDIFADARRLCNGQINAYGYDAGSAEQAEVEDLWRQAASSVKIVTREVTPAGAVVLNPTEKELLIELLAGRVDELYAEQQLLKPQYQEFLNPPLMSARALLTAVRDA